MKLPATWIIFNYKKSFCITSNHGIIYLHQERHKFILETKLSNDESIEKEIVEKASLLFLMLSKAINHISS